MQQIKLQLICTVQHCDSGIMCVCKGYLCQSPESCAESAEISHDTLIAGFHEMMKPGRSRVEVSLVLGII